ncbi:MAG: hypothetical protein SH847_07485 [Roseiflexaceae bacterium]|nr:hypothetical protein [Roseiflexaceae bacterium]
MVTKILVGIGFILILLGGGLYLTQQNALQMAATSFQTSVQQYASESVAVGMVITQILVGLGSTLVMLGTIIGLVRMIRQRSRP